MNCASVRQRLEERFDAGERPEPSLQRHLAQCPDCAVYQQALDALDAEIGLAPAIAPDAALVARIQASIAAQPRRRTPRWVPAGGLLAAIAVLIVTGWFVDLSRLSAGLAWTSWAMQEPVLPPWSVLQQELAALPEAVIQDTTLLVALARQGWDSASGTLGAVLGENGAWLWAAFVICLMGAGMSNGLEILTRNARRPRS